MFTKFQTDLQIIVRLNENLSQQMHTKEIYKTQWYYVNQQHKSANEISIIFQFSSVQSLGHVQLCDPMNRSTPGLPVLHHLPEITQTHVHWVGDTTGKTIDLTRWTFVGKEMSLLLNMLSSFVMAFLPRSKCLLISWLQPPYAMIFSLFKRRILFQLSSSCWLSLNLCEFLK